MSEVILSARNLSKSFGGVIAVNDLSFDVPEGEICALIGPNGAGKSTVFNLLTNLYRADAGSTAFLGKDLRGRAPHEIAKMGLVRTFQTARVFPHLSVVDNVLIGAHRLVRSGILGQSFWLGRTRIEERELQNRAREVLEVVGVAHWADYDAKSLPHGAQKLLELGRALIGSPRLLLLDEPAAGLNDSETANLVTMLGCIRDAGGTILVVEHNMSLVMGIADRILVIDRGRMIAEGPPGAIQCDRRVIEAYLGTKDGQQ